MGYTKDHTEDDCDKCLKRVGKENLRPLKFLFKDCNDKIHNDYNPLTHPNYKLYYVCGECYEMEKRISENQKHQR